MGGVQKVQPPGYASSSVSTALEAQKPKLAAVSTQYMDEGRLIELAGALWHKSPGLKRCSQVSFLRAVYTAAQFGLDPTGVGNQAYIIPYGSEATFVRGWGGVITMAARQGITVETFAVYESDEFAVRRLTGVTDIEHRELRPEDGSDPGEVVACYAVAFCDDWVHPMSEVVWRHDIEKIRKKSGGQAWKDWYSEMGRKTAVNRLAKRLPLFVQVKEARKERHGNKTVWASSRRTSMPLAEVPAMYEDNVVDAVPVEEDPAELAVAVDLLQRAASLKEANPKVYKQVFGKKDATKIKEGELASLVGTAEAIITTKEPDEVIAAQVKPAGEYEEDLPF